MSFPGCSLIAGKGAKLEEGVGTEAKAVTGQWVPGSCVGGGGLSWSLWTAVAGDSRRHSSCAAHLAQPV